MADADPTDDPTPGDPPAPVDSTPPPSVPDAATQATDEPAWVAALMEAQTKMMGAISEIAATIGGNKEPDEPPTGKGPWTQWPRR